MANQQNMQMPAQAPTTQMNANPQPGMEQQKMQPPKKSKWWLWVLIAVIIIGAGIASYFLFLK